MLQDNVTRFLVVHIGMMLFIPLMAVVVYLLLRGVEGTAAWVSRIALVPFVVFYSAWEVLQGIGVGILVNELNGLPQAELALREDLVQDFAEHALIGPFGVFGSIGSLGLIVAMIAAGVALHRHAAAPVSVAVLLGHLGVADHRPPTALRTHRPGPFHRRRPALRAKPIRSPGTRSPRTTPIGVTTMNTPATPSAPDSVRARPTAGNGGATADCPAPRLQPRRGRLPHRSAARLGGSCCGSIQPSQGTTSTGTSATRSPPT